MARADGFARARYLRWAGNAILALWIAGWIAFAILVGIRAATELVSAVAALICILFAIGFGLHAASRRIALRQIRELLERDDLSASRSRGRSRVR
jgi:cation transport ATPase